MGKETKQILLTIGAMITQQATAAEQQEQQATPERPNIIFILADDMGYGDLSCYGNRYIKTPNIDRLAATGTSFTQAYAGSGISSPSRCSLMTGRNSGNTRIRDNQCYAGGLTGLKINPKGDTTIVRRANLLPQDTTIAKVIGTAGYRTCLVNKWHLDGYDPGAAPNHRGFDEFYGWTISTVHSNSPYYYPYYRLWNDSLIHIEVKALFPAHAKDIMHHLESRPCVKRSQHTAKVHELPCHMRFQVVKVVPCILITPRVLIPNRDVHFPLYPLASLTQVPHDDVVVCITKFIRIVTHF